MPVKKTKGGYKFGIAFFAYLHSYVSINIIYVISSVLRVRHTQPRQRHKSKQEPFTQADIRVKRKNDAYSSY